MMLPSLVLIGARSMNEDRGEAVLENARYKTTTTAVT